MQARRAFPFLLILLVASAAASAEPRPIALHPDNPHYLLFHGKPTVLITSGEHYGAVLNLDFDCIAYLNELQARGMNLTRTFSGVYCEDQKSFNIKGNPLAPAALDRRSEHIIEFFGAALIPVAPPHVIR